MRISDDNELDEQFRALLAIATLKRSAFSKMVKESKKKSDGGEIDELEIEIDSNEISDLSEQEKTILLKIAKSMKTKIEAKGESLDEKDVIDKWAKFTLDGSVRVIESLFAKLKTP